jgi:hypothetical protein
MSEPTAPVASGSATAPAPSATPENSTPPVTPAVSPAKTDDQSGPKYNQVEIFGGGKLGIADSFQLNLGAAYLPLPWLALGLSGQTNFSSKHSILGEVGYRFRPTKAVSIQPTFLGGVGFLNDYEVYAGRLAEEAHLKGTTGLLGGEVRLYVNPTDSISFFLAPGFMHEFRGGANSVPPTLLSGDAPAADANIATLSLGFVFGTASKPISRSKDEPEDKPVSKKGPPVVLDAGKTEFDQKIATRTNSLVKDMEAEKAQKITRTIKDVRDRITVLQGKLNRLSMGINDTNQMTVVFDENREVLVKNPKGTLSAEGRSALNTQLGILTTASELDSEGRPVSDTEQSKGIRNGVRFLYLSTSTNRYGKRILKQLAALKEQLKAHKETELTAKTDEAINKLTAYLEKYPEPVKVEELHRESAEIEGSMKTLETLEKEENLSENSDWIELRKELTTTQGEVAQLTRELEAIQAFGSIFSGNTDSFADQVETPSRAESTCQSASDFLDKMGASDRYKGVTLEKLQKSYSDYFKYLSLNLSIFIKLKTPPEMKNAKERHEWFASVQKARDLLCKVNPGHARCSVALQPLSKQGGGAGAGAKAGSTPPPVNPTPPPANPPPANPPPAKPPAVPPPPPDDVDKPAPKPPASGNPTPPPAKPPAVPPPPPDDVDKPKGKVPPILQPKKGGLLGQ